VTDREKAKRLYLNGKTLTEISAELNINNATLRSWKSRDIWPKVATKKCNKKSVAKVLHKSEPIISPINDKQQLFAELYVRNFNATQSYMKAYECDYNTARTNGCLLLTKPNIKAYIENLKAIKKQSIMIDVDDVVELYMRIAFSDITNYVEFGSFDRPTISDGQLIKDVNGQPLMHKESNVILKQSDAVDGQLIEEISMSKQGAKLKLCSKDKALEWLGKFFNANPMDKHRVEFDAAKQELDRLEYERKKKHDETVDF